MNTEFPPTPAPLHPILIPDSPAGSHTPAVIKRKLSAVVGISKSAPKAAAATTTPGNVSHPGDVSHPRWFEELHKRSQEFEDVCKQGMAWGVIAQRGPFLYLNGKLLGNGIGSAAWDTILQNYELEADVRLAVRAAVNNPESGTVPATLEEALATGWRYSRTRGKALTFDRKTLRGFVELVKEGNPGILEVPFIAAVKHTAPRRRS